MITVSKFRVLCLIMALLMTASCASTGGGSAAGDSDSHGSIDTSEIDENPGTVQYYILIAEMARQQELYPVAAENYRKAAELSDDVELAQRATVMAFEIDAEDDALLAAKRWQKLDPDDVKVLPFLAKLYIRKNDIRAASKVMTKMVKDVDAKPADAFMPLGSILAYEENREGVLEALSLVAKKYRRLPQAHYTVGLQALRAGKYPIAMERASTAIKYDSDWIPPHLLKARVMIAQGEIDQGMEYAGEHVSGANSVGERVEYGILLAAVGRDLEAYAVLSQVLSDDPNNYEAERMLGIIDIKNGDLDLAERRFYQLLSAGVATYDAYYFLASIAETREQEERAYRLYSEVLRGDKAVPAQLRAAYLLYQTDRLDDALSHLERFATTYPKHTYEMAMGQGELLNEGGRKDEALLLYDSLLNQDPDNTRTQYARAFLLESMDRVDDAIHQMQIILAADPQDATALNALGYTLADRTDRLEEAYELISIAYDKEPDSGPIIDSLGWVEFKRGNLDRARELLERAYEIVKDGEIAAHLLEVAHAQNDDEFMTRHLEELRVQFAEHDTFTETLLRLGL